MKEQIEAVKSLIIAAGKAGSADEAMKKSQAALNAANAILSLRAAQEGL
jgi:hypothetical protein